MEANTLVFLAYPSTQYLVAETYDEVLERWNQARQDSYDDKATTVNLTAASGAIPPHPIAIHPGSIGAVEEALPEQVATSHAEAKKSWADWERSVQDDPTGFGA